MKIYLAFFLMFVSFTSFAQIPTNNKKCTLKIPPACFPQGAFPMYIIDGTFEDLFPPQIMKEKQFTKIIIKPIENNKRLTINIQSDNITTYHLNEDGFVTTWHLGNDRVFSYNRNEDNSLKEYSDLKINEDRSSSIDKYIYTKENDKLSVKRTLYRYDNEKQLIDETLQDHKIIKYDSKNRIIEVNELAYNTALKSYVYDDSLYFRVGLINNSAITDTLFFNKKWQPIIDKFYNSDYEFGHKYTSEYDENNKIISQQRGKIKNAKGDIDILYFQYTFGYDEDGLLDKIVRTNENCTYQVYYFTE